DQHYARADSAALEMAPNFSWDCGKLEVAVVRPDTEKRGVGIRSGKLKLNPIELHKGRCPGGISLYREGPRIQPNERYRGGRIDRHTFRMRLPEVDPKVHLPAIAKPVVSGDDIPAGVLPITAVVVKCVVPLRPAHIHGDRLRFNLPAGIWLYT